MLNRALCRSVAPLVIAYLLVACGGDDATGSAGSSPAGSGGSAGTAGSAGSAGEAGAAGSSGSGLKPCPDDIVSTPCYQALLQAIADVSTCFGHTDGCEESLSDSDCGSADDDSGLNCSWPDGATTRYQSGAPSQLAWYNASGEECARVFGLFKLGLPDGRTFDTEIIDMEQGPILHCSNGESFQYPTKFKEYACSGIWPSSCCLEAGETCSDL